jgi:hypothetical protein
MLHRHAFNKFAALIIEYCILHAIKGFRRETVKRCNLVKFILKKGSRISWNYTKPTAWEIKKQTVFQLNNFGNAYPNTWIEKLGIDKTNRRCQRDMPSSCMGRKNAKKGTVNTVLIKE